MKRPGLCVVCLAALSVVGLALYAVAGDRGYDPRPPFILPLPQTGAGKEPLHEPADPYAIFINYELGMHCVGFDISYCCIIPPYNSIQAQAVRTGREGALPRLLSPADGVRLQYALKDNSYSEGNKMRYWQVAKDVDGSGTMNHPGDNMANYVWTHLFIYQDLAGTRPEKPRATDRRRIGREIPVNIDSGPSGKIIAGGTMEYAPAKGGNVVFTDSLLPGLTDVPLTLTASYLWDALGLPLTAFNDTRRKGSIRTVTERDFQPYQYAVVRLTDDRGKPVTVRGKEVEFFGTEPVDIASCAVCHSGQGKAAHLSRQEGLTLFDREYAYWKKNYSDVSEYMARLSATTIDILELHDRHHGTTFLASYNADAASNRLGSTGPVNCPDCHGDNISGNLQTPRPGATGYAPRKGKPLSEAVHGLHSRFIPMPDRAGRTQSCQICHPAHWQNSEMNDLATNPFAITDGNGTPRFSDADLRTAGGGCFLRRDAHANPSVKPPFFLNLIGRWYLQNVSLADEVGKPVKTLRGLYCTNCHNQLAHELYRFDDLSDAVRQEGQTVRNRPLAEVIGQVAGGDPKKFREFYADPRTAASGDPLRAYYADHRSAILMRSAEEKGGGTVSYPWNGTKGEPVSYAAVSGGSDWWLSPAEPHCADCHLAPFVESGGGRYFPIDQPNKYSLFRFSKAHGDLACQSCHESAHGLYPVRFEGPRLTVDRTTHEQALQFSPDGKYAGPVTCAACHTVNRSGVPVQLKGTAYADDYWAAVVLVHYMREGDRGLSVAELVRRYPYAAAAGIVRAGWEWVTFSPDPGPPPLFPHAPVASRPPARRGPVARPITGQAE
jgi:hypothetical protein